LNTIAGMISIAAELAAGIELPSLPAVLAISGFFAPTVLIPGYMPLVYMAMQWRDGRLQGTGFMVTQL